MLLHPLEKHAAERMLYEEPVLSHFKFSLLLQWHEVFFDIFCVRFDWILCVVETIVIYCEAIVKRPEGV